MLMAQLSTECERSGRCWSSASPAPALGVTLVTSSSLPVPAPHVLPLSKHLVGQEQLPCQWYSLGMAQATLTPQVVNEVNDFGFVL